MTPLVSECETLQQSSQDFTAALAEWVKISNEFALDFLCPQTFTGSKPQEHTGLIVLEKL